MKVIAVNPRGYCHGVVTAVNMARKAAKSEDGPLYMLGYLVHNEHMTRQLQDQGIELIDSDDRIEGLNQADGGTIIFTAHGVSPQVREVAERRGLKTIDTTCSDVQVTHDLINDLVARDYDVLFVGRRGHPEADGCLGEAPGRVHLIESPEDIANLDIANRKLALTTQTTLSIWDTAAAIRAARERWPQLEIFNEICPGHPGTARGGGQSRARRRSGDRGGFGAQFEFQPFGGSGQKAGRQTGLFDRYRRATP